MQNIIVLTFLVMPLQPILKFGPQRLGNHRHLGPKPIISCHSYGRSTDNRRRTSSDGNTSLQGFILLYKSLLSWTVDQDELK